MFYCCTDVEDNKFQLGSMSRPPGMDSTTTAASAASAAAAVTAQSVRQGLRISTSNQVNDDFLSEFASWSDKSLGISPTQTFPPMPSNQVTDFSHELQSSMPLYQPQFSQEIQQQQQQQQTIISPHMIFQNSINGRGLSRQCNDANLVQRPAAQYATSSSEKNHSVGSIRQQRDSACSMISHKPRRSSCGLTQRQVNNDKRSRATHEQLVVLESVFQFNQCPGLALRIQLSKRINLTERSIQIWFQNRRAKLRNLMKNNQQRANSISGASSDNSVLPSYAIGALSVTNDGNIDMAKRGRRNTLPQIFPEIASSATFTPLSADLELSAENSPTERLNTDEFLSLQVGNWKYSQDDGPFLCSSNNESGCFYYYCRVEGHNYCISYPFTFVQRIELAALNVAASFYALTRRREPCWQIDILLLRQPLVAVEVLHPNGYRMWQPSQEFLECELNRCLRHRLTGMATSHHFITKLAKINKFIGSITSITQSSLYRPDEERSNGQEGQLEDSDCISPTSLSGTSSRQLAMQRQPYDCESTYFELSAIDFGDVLHPSIFSVASLRDGSASISHFRSNKKQQNKLSVSSECSLENSIEPSPLSSEISTNDGTCFPKAVENCESVNSGNMKCPEEMSKPLLIQLEVQKNAVGMFTQAERKYAQLKLDELGYARPNMHCVEDDLKSAENYLVISRDNDQDSSAEQQQQPQHDLEQEQEQYDDPQRQKTSSSQQKDGVTPLEYVQQSLSDTCDVVQAQEQIEQSEQQQGHHLHSQKQYTQQHPQLLSQQQVLSQQHQRQMSEQIFNWSFPDNVFSANYSEIGVEAVQDFGNIRNCGGNPSASGASEQLQASSDCAMKKQDEAQQDSRLGADAAKMARSVSDLVELEADSEYSRRTHSTTNSSCSFNLTVFDELDPLMSTRTGDFLDLGLSLGPLTQLPYKNDMFIDFPDKDFLDI